MRNHFRRREFITLIGSAAAVWPMAAKAQQPAMPVIGFLHSASPGQYPRYIETFLKPLNETGFVVARNVAIEFRWAEGRFDLLPMLAADLVRRKVNVLVAAGGSNSALAAKAATVTIPIVFAGGGDPVALGLVASFNRPGGNATGFRILDAFTEAKRLGLLRELVPGANSIAVLYNPRNANFEFQMNDVEVGARSVDQKIHVLKASTGPEIETAFATLVQLRADALLVGADPFLDGSRDQIVALAARHSVPTLTPDRGFVEVGGLMSYGPSFDELYRQVGVYTARILKGAKPPDLPVVQTTKFELIINLKTAKALGIKISDNLLSLADKVIE